MLTLTACSGADEQGLAPDGTTPTENPSNSAKPPPQSSAEAPPPPPPRGPDATNDGRADEAPLSVVDPVVVEGTGFALTSPTMQDGGALPVRFTCDGDSITPPLAWENAPEGTVSYAILMDHQPEGGGYKWYWVAYDISADITSLDAGAIVPGTLGSNSVNNEQGYAPPCSRGPGEKLYTFHAYALSATPDIPESANADRDTLLTTIEEITLATADLDVIFDRENPVSAKSSSKISAGSH